MAKQDAAGTSEVMAAIQDGLLAEMGGKAQEHAAPAPSEDRSEVVEETQESQAQPTQPPDKEDRAEAKPAEVPIDERVARMVQSQLDKRVHEERMRWERAQEEKRRSDEQERAVSAMSDEEYGQWMREREQMQGIMEKASLARTSAVLMQLHDDALKMVPDDAARKVIAERAQNGEIKSFGQLMQEVNDALVQHKVGSLTAKITKEVRESVLKELGATETEGGPELGTGAATPVFVDWRNKSTTQLIAEGLEEDARRSRRR
jgi:DNA uptake protein ComE-like DNA-binding protein